MSKSGTRRRIPPAVHSDDEDSAEEGPAVIPETRASEMRPVEPGRPEQEETAAGGAGAPPPDTWRALSGQLELLLRTMAQLAIMVAEVGERMKPRPGAILDVTPQTAVIAAVMAVAMVADAPHTAAGAAMAPLPAATLGSAAVAATAPHPTAACQLGAGAEAARQPGVAAAALEMPSGGALPPGVVACTGVPVPVEAAASQEEDTLTALAVPDRRGRSVGGRRPEQRWRAEPPRPQGSEPVSCFRCGQRGHIEWGCRNAPGAFAKASPPSTGSSSGAASGPQGESRRINHTAAPLTSHI
ncbi:unnamed protein product [Lampetra fluviatilis]